MKALKMESEEAEKESIPAIAENPEPQESEIDNKN